MSVVPAPAAPQVYVREPEWISGQLRAARGGPRGVSVEAIELASNNNYCILLYTVCTVIEVIIIRVIIYPEYFVRMIVVTKIIIG